MSDLEPTEPTTTTDLDPTTITPAAPVTPVTPVAPGAPATSTAGAPLTPDDGPAYAVEQPAESAVAWATPVPVRPPSSGSGRGRRLRWAAAIAVIAVVLGTSAALAAFITGAASQSTVIGYVPSDSVAYVEARLDLPGDQ